MDEYRQEDDLIVFKTFDNAIDAHLMQGQLEANDIESYIVDENIVTLLPIYNLTVGGVKLKIREADRDKATAIITENLKAKLTDEDDKVIACPRCSSNKISGPFRSMKSIGGLIAAVAAGLVTGYPLFYFLVYKCDNCGKEFERKEQ